MAGDPARYEGPPPPAGLEIAASTPDAAGAEPLEFYRRRPVDACGPSLVRRAPPSLVGFPPSGVVPLFGMTEDLHPLPPDRSGDKRVR